MHLKGAEEVTPGQRFYEGPNDIHTVSRNARGQPAAPEHVMAGSAVADMCPDIFRSRLAHCSPIDGKRIVAIPLFDWRGIQERELGGMRSVLSCDRTVDKDYGSRWTTVFAIRGSSNAVRSPAFLPGAGTRRAASGLRHL